MKQCIEEKRKELYDLAEKFGLSDYRVLKKSRELDKLLNLYTFPQLKSQLTNGKGKKKGNGYIRIK